MAVTLIEASQIALGRDETLRSGIIQIFAENSPLLDAMIYENISGNALTFSREATLPSVAFRGVNEAYTANEGVLEDITESLKIAGGDLDVDTFLVKTGGPNQLSTQTNMKAKSLSLTMEKKIIKGDNTTYVKEFDGLQNRCTGDQLVHNAVTTGAGLSLVKLDELIDAVANPTHLIMNKTHVRRLSAATRSTTVAGTVIFEKDTMGRRVAYYNDLPILIVGKDETNTEILGFTEQSWNTTDWAGADANSASIYCISIGIDALHMIQNGIMDVRYLGELQTAPVHRTRIEWYTSLANMIDDCKARLSSVENSAATA